MKVGDYVRTQNGDIFKYVKYDEQEKQYRRTFSSDNLSITTAFKIENVIKTSTNLIDLIEVHDVLKLFDKEYGLEYKAEVLLNEEGYKYISNYECSDLLNLEWELISGEHVKILSIVTKEAFESMEYKIGE